MFLAVQVYSGVFSEKDVKSGKMPIMDGCCCFVDLRKGSRASSVFTLVCNPINISSIWFMRVLSVHYNFGPLLGGLINSHLVFSSPPVGPHTVYVFWTISVG